MPIWHIVDQRQLQGITRVRGLHAVLLLMVGVCGGLALAQSGGGIAWAHAAEAQPAVASPVTARGWCESAGGLRLSCALQPSQ